MENNDKGKANRKPEEEVKHFPNPTPQNASGAPGKEGPDRKTPDTHRKTSGQTVNPAGKNPIDQEKLFHEKDPVDRSKQDDPQL